MVRTSPLRQRRQHRKEGVVPLLWLLVILLVIFAIVGGVAINNFLWLVLIIALVVALLAYM
jgi:predicted lysophospholipase L1 biosynthesis ABC-type transport system permease subunit